MPGIVESLWRRKVLMILVVSLAAIGGYVVPARQPPVYQSTSTLLFSKDPLGDRALLPDQNQGTFLAGEAARVTSAPVMGFAAGRLGDGTTVGDVAARVTASPGVTGATLEITATGGSAETAAHIANVVADSYLTVVRRQVQTHAQDAANRLQQEYVRVQSEIDELSRASVNEDTTPRREALQARLQVLSAQLSELSAQSARFDTGVEITKPADAATPPVSPTPGRDSLLATLLGLLAAGVLAWAMELHAHRHSDLARIARLLGAPGLGRVPTLEADLPDDARMVRSAPSGPTRSARRHAAPSIVRRLSARLSRAFTPARDLQEPGDWQYVVAALDAALTEVDGRTIILTSPTVLAGFQETAERLAMAAAEDGRSVALVDADPASRESFAPDADKERGLNEIIEQRNGSRKDLGRSDAVDPPRISLVPAGRPPSDSAAFFRRPAFRERVTALASRADLVVVCAPPVLGRADARVLADVVDAVVLVLSPSVTDSQLTQTRQRLAAAKSPVIGFVMQAAASRRRRPPARITRQQSAQAGQPAPAPRQRSHVLAGVVELGDSGARQS